jgi:hypothetical protein
MKAVFALLLSHAWIAGCLSYRTWKSPYRGAVSLGFMTKDIQAITRETSLRAIHNPQHLLKNGSAIVLNEIGLSSGRTRKLFPIRIEWRDVFIVWLSLSTSLLDAKQASAASFSSLYSLASSSDDFSSIFSSCPQAVSLFLTMVGVFTLIYVAVNNFASSEMKKATIKLSPVSNIVIKVDADLASNMNLTGFHRLSSNTFDDQVNARALFNVSYAMLSNMDSIRSIQYDSKIFQVDKKEVELYFCRRAGDAIDDIKNQRSRSTRLDPDIAFRMFIIFTVVIQGLENARYKKMVVDSKDNIKQLLLALAMDACTDDGSVNVTSIDINLLESYKGTIIANKHIGTPTIELNIVHEIAKSSDYGKF